jgi:hypothetical protein
VRRNPADIPPSRKDEDCEKDVSDHQINPIEWTTAVIHKEGRVSAVTRSVKDNELIRLSLGLYHYT